jgi:outer membrane protein assembly factor BamD (BamD/ComL family)
MMKKNCIITGLALLTLSFLSSNAEAAYTIQNGSIVNADVVATLPIDQHFKLGQAAIEKNDWREASRQFTIVTTCFPNSPLGQESFYYLGVAEYNMKEYDFANDAFTQYLKCQNNPQHFLSAIEYKYYIAEQFRCGACRRFFGTKQLPKWATGQSMGLKIYDEVIAAMPSHEMATRALYSKGFLLWELEEYRDSIEAFQLLCKRFPRSELTPDSYVIISRIYFDLCKSEPQNPDILAFAELNARKFKQEFPKEERVRDAELNVQQIKELYAGALYETGRFYERVKQPRASIIYYYNAVHQFPQTEIARRCIERLHALDPTFNEKDLIKENPPKETSDFS